ncbi:hypothetical protein ACLESD_20325 [Pyxidicoccus sp. 3LFB2]
MIPSPKYPGLPYPRDVRLVRVDSRGQEQWSRLLGGPLDGVRGLHLVDARSAVLITLTQEPASAPMKAQLHWFDLEGKSVRSVPLQVDAYAGSTAVDARGRLGILLHTGQVPETRTRLALVRQDGTVEEEIALEEGMASSLAPAEDGWIVVGNSVSSHVPPEERWLHVARVKSNAVVWTRKLPCSEPADHGESRVDLGGFAAGRETIAIVTHGRNSEGDRLVLDTLSLDGTPRKRQVLFRTLSIIAHAAAFTPSGGLYIAGTMSGAASFGESQVNTLEPVDRNHEGFLLYVERP